MSIYCFPWIVFQILCNCRPFSPPRMCPNPWQPCKHSTSMELLLLTTTMLMLILMILTTTRRVESTVCALGTVPLHERQSLPAFSIHNGRACQSIRRCNKNGKGSIPKECNASLVLEEPWKSFYSNHYQHQHYQHHLHPTMSLSCFASIPTHASLVLPALTTFGTNTTRYLLPHWSVCHAVPNFDLIAMSAVHRIFNTTMIVSFQPVARSRFGILNHHRHSQYLCAVPLNE
jgi:hypothetical protein